MSVPTVRGANSYPLTVMDIAALVVSIVSAVGAVGAVWYARRSDRSAAKSAAAFDAYLTTGPTAPGWRTRGTCPGRC